MMCLIIDIPVIHKVFPAPEADFKPLYNYVTSGRAKIVYGGKLRREYVRVEWFRRLLLRLDQQGSARRVPDAGVDAAAKKVYAGNLCTSNDHHIIGLAVVAAVRLLCTDDQKLIADFKSKKLLDNPRGKVYRYATHGYLLKQHCG